MMTVTHIENVLVFFLISAADYKTIGSLYISFEGLDFS